MAIGTEPTITPADVTGGDAVIETFDPRTGARLAVVPDVDAEGVRAAVARARCASAAWSALHVRERVAHLRVVRDRMLERAEELVEVICAETGKQRSEAVTTELMADRKSVV